MTVGTHIKLSVLDVREGDTRCAERGYRMRARGYRMHVKGIEDARERIQDEREGDTG